MTEFSSAGRRGPSYRDHELAAAVATAHSWRAVLRALGLAGTSASAIRSARRHADRLGLDYGHFTGARRWTDIELADAVRQSHSWSAVAQVFRLAGGSSENALKGHVARLGLDASHFEPAHRVSGPDRQWPAADLAHLSRAGSVLAAGWFMMRGYEVAWPLEPCRYDFLVSVDGVVQRVQVKTTTVRAGSTWVVWLSKSRKVRVAYGPDEIDYFFVIDGDFCHYLVPVATVGGLHAIHVSAYSAYRVDSSAITGARRLPVGAPSSAP